MLDVLNAGATAIYDSIAYLRNNAWSIVIMLAVWFILKPKVIDAMDDLKTRRSPQQVKTYDNDLRRVRQMQQLQAEEEAKIKSRELKEKKAMEPQEKTVAEQTVAKKPKKKMKASSAAAKPPASNLTMNSFSSGPSYRCVICLLA